MGRGVISPYVDIFVPLKAIQEIWIGPTNDSNLAEDSLKSWLESIGMNWIKIKKSSFKDLCFFIKEDFLLKYEKSDIKNVYSKMTFKISYVKITQ